MRLIMDRWDTPAISNTDGKRRGIRVMYGPTNSRVDSRKEDLVTQESISQQTQHLTMTTSTCRMDSLPVTKKKSTPKSLTQMKKKSMQKPSKKMDKMYKKMLEKQRLQKKREKYEKLHKAKKQQVP